HYQTILLYGNLYLLVDRAIHNNFAWMGMVPADFNMYAVIEVDGGGDNARSFVDDIVEQRLNG
ncbi:MAG: hypothetical protein B6D74_03620, partial [gamma proteobacterium symbiont of Ctena orbiculata]